MKNKTLKKILKYFLIFLIIIFTVSFVFSFPVLIMNLNIHDFFPFIKPEWFKYSDYGTTGDAIGGMTAPVVNLIGAFLVYLALREQVKANDIVQKQLDKSEKEKRTEEENKILENMFSYTIKSVEKIEYITPKGESLYGIPAIQTILVKVLRDNHEGGIKKIEDHKEFVLVYNTVQLFDVILDYIDESEATLATKFTINKFLQHSYATYISTGIEVSELQYKSILSNPICPQCNVEHKLPKKLLDAIEKIDFHLKSNTEIFDDIRKNRLNKNTTKSKVINEIKARKKLIADRLDAEKEKA
ncbi:MAG: hypothetical protein IPG89_05850 [Bacteroidetes bacterium]|nr:hypothetical protein [Bacteroidota bacterium]